MMIYPILLLLLGIASLIWFGNKTVDFASQIAMHFRLPTLFVGIVIIAIGTDLPEIMNSILSSSLGHGDINVGNSIGSCLAQITLIPAMIVLFYKSLPVRFKDIITPGVPLLFSLILLAVLLKDGYLSSSDGLILVSAFIIQIYLIYKYLTFEVKEKPLKNGLTSPVYLTALFLVLSLIGVLFGAYLTVEGIVQLSKMVGIPEFIISFFIAAIGTSMPEIAIDVIAIKKKKPELAIGDMLGSNLIDTTLSVGIGPLLFPISVSLGYALTAILYTFIATFIMIALMSFRKKLDKWTALVAIGLYLLSYLVVTHA